MTRSPRERARELLTPTVELAGSALEALEGADAAVLVTEWAEFAELDWAEAARADGAPADRRRAQLPRPQRSLREAGFEYEGIGRSCRASPLACLAPTSAMQAIVLVGGEGHAAAAR